MRDWERNASWRPQKGFTILEALITVAITSLLSGILIFYGSGTRNRITLTLETARFAQTVVRAKERALATYVDPDPLNRVCGYGVEVNPASRSYVLFGYRLSDCRTISSIDPANFVLVTTTTLRGGIRFGSGPNRLDAVLFVPPDPDTFLWSQGGFLLSNTGSFYLSIENSAASSAVSVNRGGQINF